MIAKRQIKEQVPTSEQQKKYDRTLYLFYNDDCKRWQIGKFVVEMSLVPTLFVNNNHNINCISINIMNKGYDTDYNNFAMGFDSVGTDEKGVPVLYAKFDDAFIQLEKNKSNIERYLKTNIDIDILKSLKPLILEFEKRAEGKAAGHDELPID